VYCNIVKLCSATLQNYVVQHKKHALQNRKICTATSKNYVLQHRKLCTATSVVPQHRKNQPRNMEMKTFENHLLQQPKNPIATFENHLLQHKKTHCNTKKHQGRTKQQGDGFYVQAAPALGPSPSSSPERGGNSIPELTGTLATVVSLGSRG